MQEFQAKILIVDDKRVNRVILERHLQKVGYTNIYQATNGVEAMEIIDKQLPDLILLDIVMPEMDGFEVCRRVKSNERTKMLPIVMVTALDDQESKLKCINIGADDILNKPVDPAELTARVRSLIHVKNYFDQLQQLNDQLLDNIRKAEKIQRALLPKKFPEITGVQFQAFYEPAEYVGGDCYNVIPLDQERVCIYIADVTGHQFDAAMLTVFLKEIISGYVRQVTLAEKVFSPSECLEQLDQAFKREDFPVEIFITIYLAVYDYSTKKLTYSSAGFAQSPVVVCGQEMRSLECSGKLIMALDVPGGFQELTATINPGESLFLYTDGLIEQLDKQGQEQYGEERLFEELKSLSDEQCHDVINNVLQKLELFAGTKDFEDDIALIQMRVF